MSQYDFGTIDPYVWDGVQLADALNQWRGALNSMHRGAARPSYAVAGMMWINDAGGATNWIVNVYLGAQGDKPLFNYNTSTGEITMSAASGGTLTAAHHLAQAAAAPSVRWDATGNPIDQKRWRVTITGTGALRFTAYSDADVANSTYVEFARDGTVAGSKPALSLVSEALGTGSTNNLTVTFPATKKIVELYWYLQLTPATNAAISFRGWSGSIISGSIYNTLNMVQSSTTVAGELLALGTSWPLVTGIGTAGRATFEAIASPSAIGTAEFWVTNSTPTRSNIRSTFDSDGVTGITGFYFSTAAGNFNSSSYVRCLALT